MPLGCSTDGFGTTFGQATLYGSWFGCPMGGDCCGVCSVNFRWNYPGFGATDTTHEEPSGDCLNSGSFSATINPDFDRTVEFRARAVNDQCFGTPAIGAILTFKSFADHPTAGVPAVSAITSGSATISDTFNAKVVESTFQGSMQYRTLGSATWVTAGASVSSGVSISRDITGLVGGTTYEVRFSGSRGTENDTTWVSVTVNFTTTLDSPTITTDSPSIVADTSAILAGTVDPNGLSVRVRFAWGTSDGGSDPNAWGNLTPFQDYSGDGNQGVQQAIIGLSASTAYFYRAFVEWSAPNFLSIASGTTVSFTTPASPLAQAAQEDHMQIFEYDGKFGVQSTFSFMLSSPAATSSDRFVTTAPGSLFVAGDIKLSKDSGAFSNVTNTVVQPTASNPLYTLTLTTTEMQGTILIVQIVDQNGPAFRDAMIMIRTKFQIGQIDVQADQIGASAAAMILRPAANGYSLDMQDSAGTNIGRARGFLESMAQRASTAQAGASATITLDASASATNDYYNGDVIFLSGGTGVGQSRVITDYDGATKVATVNASWAVNPDSTSRFVIIPGQRVQDFPIPELTGIPSAADTLAKKIQFCFQRFAFKVDQTATLQTLYNSSGVSLGTRSVSDDGTTQTIQKVV